ncbi:MAG: hydantoinase/oxoprolinase family protein, partial [Anaerolineae bacterium]|nr:hydantoinase/oxoprolinase family protein [Anaerolineae bacterium]
MQIVLGIDTGGTYTDAALVDYTSGQVLACAKSLTTHHHLSIGVENAIAAVFEAARQQELELYPRDINLVGLSTTLATNAIVEGQGNSVALLLIGYDPAAIKRHGFEHDLVTGDIVYLEGGHDGEGNEAAPLDEDALRSAVLERRD